MTRPFAGCLKIPVEISLSPIVTTRGLLTLTDTTSMRTSNHRTGFNAQALSRAVHTLAVKRIARFGNSGLRFGKESQDLAHQLLPLVGFEDVLSVRGPIEDHQLFRIWRSLILIANLGESK